MRLSIIFLDLFQTHMAQNNFLFVYYRYLLVYSFLFFQLNKQFLPKIKNVNNNMLAKTWLQNARSIMDKIEETQIGKNSEGGDDHGRYN